jgi:tyrosine-protein kinase Etk/Wzc
MSSVPDSNLQPTTPGDEDTISLLDLLIVVAKYKVSIVIVPLGSACLAVVVSLLLPNIYTGTATILPPQQSQSAAAMVLGQLGGLAGLAGGSVGGLKNSNDLYVGMLESRTVADSLIGRFDLQKLYDRETMADTRKQLAKNTVVSAGRNGLITVQFDDEDSKRAAEVANAYVEELDKLTQTLAVTEAAQRRLFFERELKKAKVDLTEAELALQDTQEKTGLIALDEQGKAIFASVASLRAQIAAKEVELRAMRTFATDRNADVVRTQQQLAGLRAELSKLERTQMAGAGVAQLPTAKLPEVGREYLQKLRDVKYHEAVFEILAKQFEAAKLDESRESTIVQIVDQALPPDRKSKPRRSVMVILTFLAMLIITVLWAFVREMIERASHSPLQAARLRTLRHYLWPGSTRGT